MCKEKGYDEVDNFLGSYIVWLIHTHLHHKHGLIVLAIFLLNACGENKTHLSSKVERLCVCARALLYFIRRRVNPSNPSIFTRK